MSPSPTQSRRTSLEASGEKALIDVLKKPDAELKAKMDACRELGHLGTAKAIPVLAELLGEDKLSHMARYGLEPIPDPAVDEVLRGALGKLDGRLLAGVVTSIGVRRDGEAVPALVDLLDHADTDVCAAAARSLARIAAPKAVDALSRKLATAPAGLRMAIADACLECVENLLESGRSGEADKLCGGVLHADLPEHVHAAARRRREGAAGKAGG